MENYVDFLDQNIPSIDDAIKKLKGIDLYVIVNSEGKFLNGQTWRSEPLKAKLYNKIGVARAQVTRMTNKNETPFLLKFKLGSFEIQDEAARIKEREIKSVRKELKSRRKFLNRIINDPKYQDRIAGFEYHINVLEQKLAKLL